VEETANYTNFIINEIKSAQYLLNQTLLHKLYLLSGSISTASDKITAPKMRLASFVHSCYIICANEIGFRYPMLFDSVNATGEKRQKNHLTASKKILQHIWITVDHVLLPYIEELRKPPGTRSFSEIERRISPDGIRSTINSRGIYDKYDTLSVGSKIPEPTDSKQTHRTSPLGNETPKPPEPTNSKKQTNVNETPMLEKITRANEKTLRNDDGTSGEQPKPTPLKTADKKPEPAHETKTISTSKMDLILEDTVKKSSKKSPEPPVVTEEPVVKNEPVVSDPFVKAKKPRKPRKPKVVQPPPEAEPENEDPNGGDEEEGFNNRGFLNGEETDEDEEEGGESEKGEEDEERGDEEEGGESEEEEGGEEEEGEESEEDEEEFTYSKKGSKKPLPPLNKKLPQIKKQHLHQATKKKPTRRGW